MLLDVFDILCVFVVACYGIWGVVLYGMSAPRLNIGGGMLLLGFFLFGDV